MSEIIERVASAIELAEVGYHLRLTSLVDEVSTYTLSYDDDTPDLTFEWIDDAYAHIAKKKRQAAARLAIEAMRSPPDEIVSAIEAKAQERYEAAPAMQRFYGEDIWNAGIDAALEAPAPIPHDDRSPGK